MSEDRRRPRARPSASGRGRSTSKPLTGGISNASFTVKDDTGTYVVRVGEDYPCSSCASHERELHAARAAFEAGLSPEVVHTEPGIMVMRYHRGADLYARPMCAANAVRCVEIVKRCHREHAASA